MGFGGEWVQPQFTRLLSLQLVKTAELDPSRNYLAGFHPHGILCPGAFTNLCTEGTGFSSVFPGIRSHLMMLHWGFWPRSSGITSCQRVSPVTLSIPGR